MNRSGFLRRDALALGLALLVGSAARAAPGDAALVPRLRAGGLVLLMRHAHAPAQPPGSGRERELDAAGEESARRFGEALRALKVPIGEVEASPTVRALQTVRLAGLGPARAVEALGDGGHSMSARTAGGGAGPEWLKAEVRRAPPAGTNRLLVTHQPNIVAALGQGYADLTDGEMLVIEPASGRVLGRIRIDAWPGLAAAA
jgi:phosphohistidine phosphatase SixA